MHHPRSVFPKNGPFRLRCQWLLLAILVLTGWRIQAAESYQLQVVCDPADALYETGDEVKFVITLSRGGSPVESGAVSYAVDDFITGHPPASDFPKGALELTGKPLVVSVSSGQPGFLRCQVSFRPPEGKPVRAVAGAAFSPTKIQPSLPVPDDFDAFWNDQKKKLAAVAWEPALTSVEHPSEKIDCFDVRVPCLGGAPVSGYFGLPKGAEPKSLPAVLWVHGAGVRSSRLTNAAKGAEAGMLSMDINAHGIPNGKPGEFYSDLSEGELKNYRHDGRESRETIYFRGMFLRLVRAIDFLTSRPEWDGEHVIVIGHSQGGGQALAAGGLDDRVTMIASGVPAICDHSGRAAGRINGWPKLVPAGEDGSPEAKILEAARYVDAVNFAARCQADAIMSVGFIDSTCPPSSCYAAFNCLGGRKRMINEPLMGHAALPHIHAAFFARMLEHVGKSKPDEE